MTDRDLDAGSYYVSTVPTYSTLYLDMCTTQANSETTTVSPAGSTRMHVPILSALAPWPPLLFGKRHTMEIPY